MCKPCFPSLRKLEEAKIGNIGGVSIEGISQTLKESTSIFLSEIYSKANNGWDYLSS